jgi:Ferric reductase like transmembrane component
VSAQTGDEMTKKTNSLARTMIPRRYQSPIFCFMSKTSDFVHENWKRIWLLTLWIIVNLVLFVWKFQQYKKSKAFQIMGYCVCFAKGAAETLKLNMALILIPVCRNTLTRLRSTILSSIIPFDDNINFHKIIALAITIATFIHTIMHISCDFPRLVTCPRDKFENILGPDFDYKQPTVVTLLISPPGWTGVLMVIIMTFSFTLATHFFRRRAVKLSVPYRHLAGFNAFWYAHHLLVLVYIMLVIHSFFIFLTKEWYKKTVHINSHIEL